MSELIVGTTFETIFSYHADTVALGAMVQRAGVPHLVLTHLTPGPETPEDALAFEKDARQGDYAGMVTVGEDLTNITKLVQKQSSAGHDSNSSTVQPSPIGETIRANQCAVLR